MTIFDAGVSGGSEAEFNDDFFGSSNAGFFNRSTNKKIKPQTLAANAIREGIAQAGGIVEEGVDTARSDLDPFTQAGLSSLKAIQPLINDPNAQKDFIQNNYSEYKKYLENNIGI